MYIYVESDTDIDPGIDIDIDIAIDIHLAIDVDIDQDTVGSIGVLVLLLGGLRFRGSWYVHGEPSKGFLWLAFLPHEFKTTDCSLHYWALGSGFVWWLSREGLAHNTVEV